MDEISLFGVSFRSSVHVIWFFLSLGQFFLCAVLYRVLRKRLRNRARTISPSSVWEYAMCMHATVAILAAILTQGGSREYGSYSPDCIWWNALLAVMYAGLFLIARRATQFAR